MLRGLEVVDGMLVRGLGIFGGRRALRPEGYCELASTRFKKRLSETGIGTYLRLTVYQPYLLALHCLRHPSLIE
jgi:hypothetical protein